jgi:nitrogen fixation/metabolism regulation signal transduction histidine kinase
MADEVEKNRTRAASLEKIAAWQIIARKLAHEIKNPLTPIQMMASQLKRRYKGDDESFLKLLTSAEKIISEEVRGLHNMVDRFSEFAKLPEPALRSIDLTAIIKHATELERAAFPEHTIRLDLPETALECLADDVLIRQVLVNLIKNAAEASLNPPSSIIVSAKKDGKDVLIQVEDNGPGIPTGIKEKIFEAYFTTKQSIGLTGMGLGLSVCQKIILDHKGQLTVDSEPGHTIFTIRIPTVS